MSEIMDESSRKVSSTALEVVFKDGSKVILPVGMYRYHMDYFHELLRVSKEFAKLYRKHRLNIDWDSWNISVFLKMLNSEGAVVVLNSDIHNLFDDPAGSQREFSYMELIIPSDISQEICKVIINDFSTYSDDFINITLSGSKKVENAELSINDVVNYLNSLLEIEEKERKL